MMQNAFGNECVSKTRIKEWYNRFKGGRTSVDSDSRSGRPSTIKTLDNIDNKILGITRVCAVTGFFTAITRQRIHRILCSSF